MSVESQGRATRNVNRPDDISANDAVARWPHFGEADERFWSVFQLVLDALAGCSAKQSKSVVDGASLIELLERRAKRPAARAEIGWVRELFTEDPPLLDRIASYLSWRRREGARRLGLMRTETEALAALAALDANVAASVRSTRLPQHGNALAPSTTGGKGKTILVATVELVTAKALGEIEVEPGEFAGNQRVIQTEGSEVWVSPRRLDGAWPSWRNPREVRELKEYWGRGGGSKMSDAIYETELMGRALQRVPGPKIAHHLFLDGAQQWSDRMSDLRRAIDLLQQGLIDDLFCGEEVLERWPGVIRAIAESAGR